MILDENAMFLLRQAIAHGAITEDHRADVLEIATAICQLDAGIVPAIAEAIQYQANGGLDETIRGISDDTEERCAAEPQHSIYHRETGGSFVNRIKRIKRLIREKNDDQEK